MSIYAPIDNTAWTSFTPAVTANSGTFTTASATGRYKQLGKTVHFNVNITLTTVGTGTGVQFALPVTAFSNDRVIGNYREGVTTGFVGIVRLISTTVGILNEYDNSQTLANGNVFYCQGTYEAA